MAVVAALTAKQTGTKQITVNVAKALTNPNALSIKKDSVDVAVATKDGIVISTDKKTLTITTASVLTDGEYTVTTAEEDGKNVATFTAQDEKVNEIKFLSDVAVLDGTNANKATVAYKVYNQFGEDITKATALEFNGSDVDTSNSGDGVITFTKSSGNYTLTDVVAAVAIYKNGTNVVTQTGTFKISSAAIVNEITIKDGVYNKDGKELTADSDTSKDAYYVLFTAKDQYGNAIDLAKDTNALIQVAAGTTTLTNTLTIEPKKITVDGVDYQAIKLTGSLKAGTATIILISKGNGYTAQTSVKVANGSNVDKLTLTFPSLIVGGETVDVEYTALDTYGKEVTNFDKITACEGIADTEQDGLYAVQDPVTKKTSLKYKAKSNTTDANDVAVVNVITSSYQVVTKQLSIRPNAVAKAITGTKDLTTGAVVGKEFSVKKENIVVQDQYGRTDKLADTAYAIKITKVTDDDTVLASGSSFAANTALVKGTATTATTKKAGSVEVVFTLYVDSAATKSTITVNFVATENNSIKSYEVADIGTIYNGSFDTAAYEKAIDVKGVLADGTKVAIPAEGFSVIDADVTTTTAGKIKAKEDLTTADKALEKVNSVTKTITVIINATGEEFQKEVVISKEAPKAVTVSYATDGANHFVVADAATAANTVGLTKLLPLLKIKDQYGVEHTADVASVYDKARVTFTDLVNATVTGNGTTGATLTVGTDGNAEATVKITFADGSTFTGALRKN